MSDRPQFDGDKARPSDLAEEADVESSNPRGERDLPDWRDHLSDPREDPRDDPMAPPREPCECYCLHCRRTFCSSEMWFQRVVGSRDGFAGFWMCPTPNCDGAGFTFDIFPTHPDHPANEGWYWDDDEDEEAIDGSGEPAEYDPAEPQYRELDEDLAAFEEEDIEGEEWKFGLAPGELLPQAEDSEWEHGSREEWEEEQKRFDMPDERPRVIDWSHREDPPLPGGGQFSEDDIPF